MKVVVDRNTCIGCGLCEAACPEVFEMDENNIAKGVEGEIPDALKETAIEAESQCPVSSIRIE